MKHYYKLVKNGKLIALYEQNGAINDTDYTELTEEQYNAELNAMIEFAKVIRQYIEQVKDGTITIDDVPEDYKSEVEATINQPEMDPPNNDYGVANETYNAIIDDYTLSLMDSGVL